MPCRKRGPLRDITRTPDFCSGHDLPLIRRYVKCDSMRCMQQPVPTKAVLSIAVCIILVGAFKSLTSPKITAYAQAVGAGANKSTAPSSALHEAEDKNDVETVKRLIRQGADVNARNARGWPVLVSAASAGHVEITGLLLQAGASVNEKEPSNGGTALFWAAFKGHPDVVKLLLDNKADPNIKTNNETSPLMATALTRAPNQPPEATNIAIAELLLKKGANVNDPDNHGALPRGSAASNSFNQLADFLKKNGGKCAASSGIVLHNCSD
jgi:ankyrin repeat protein